MMNLGAKRPPTSFKTKRLSIQRCDPAFTDRLFESAAKSIEEIYPFLPWCHPGYQKPEANQWLEIALARWRNGDAYDFSIFSLDDGALLGGCSVSIIDDHPVGNLGYWIRTGSTGVGMATEATLGLAEFSFQFLDLQRIEIVMSTENAGSRQVAINAGARFEGTLRNRLLLHGQKHDAHLYSLVPESSKET
ncbi:MAG: RimJ/RimL family protein N-acetyltransferase [Candidatus Azotimanducaceae bacterium]|jgi:RimJ/RimL family protein N-acetyltransferase